MSVLITLAKHNELIRKSWELVRFPRKNGIACPECGHELQDTDHELLGITNPPQTRVSCSHCIWKGTRLA